MHSSPNARRRRRFAEFSAIAALLAAVACAPRAPSGLKSDNGTAGSKPQSEKDPRTVDRNGAAKVQYSTPYRAQLGHGAEIYIPPWFVSDQGAYDLVIHFHGLGRLQEANLQVAQLNAVVVSVNFGGTSEHYSRNYRDPHAFTVLLDAIKRAVTESGRANGEKVRRLALTAWSAGFLAISRIINDPEVEGRVDAILLADGFFSTYTNPRTREVNVSHLGKWVKVTEAATRGDKLLAITHSAIPGFKYPGVDEVVGELLKMTSLAKTPSSAVGPQKMQETYSVDKGAFHVHGYEGQRAGDHIRHIRAMGETLYPYLVQRWSTYPSGK